MSYGGGPCFGCKRVVGRFDDDRRRFACEDCWPHRTRAEIARASLLLMDDQAAYEPKRRPSGITRQEWRRQQRAGGS